MKGRDEELYSLSGDQVAKPTPDSQRVTATLVISVLVLLVSLAVGAVVLTGFLGIREVKKDISNINGGLVNLDSAKATLVAYMDGGSFDDDMQKLTATWAKYFEDKTPSKMDLIVSDIDDTVLSSYPEMKNISFGYVAKITEDYELRADSPVIAQTQMLLTNLVTKGYKLAFITGRHEPLRNATADNLKLRNLDNYVELILRQPDEYKLTAQEYKNNARAALVKKGYNVIASIGDQWSDINGDNVGYRMKVINYAYFIA